MNKEANQQQQTLMIMYYNSFVCISILQKSVLHHKISMFFFILLF